MLEIVGITFLMVTVVFSTNQLESSAQGITVLINEEQQHYEHPPIIQDGRTLVPLRGIFESLGATVDWNQNERKVTAVKGQSIIELIIGSKQTKINGNLHSIDVPAQISNGSTLVPLRFVVEALGADVHWDNTTQTIKIRNADTDKKVSAPVDISAVASEGKIYVSWDINTNIDYYYVYFSDSFNGNYSPFLDNDIKYRFLNGVIDEGVKHGETWYYKVTAVKNGVESVFSKVVSASIPSVSLLNDLILVADDDDSTYLGLLTTNIHDTESIFNNYGDYGSPYSLNSIWNEYGSYGSPYNLYSAFNQYSNTPPIIIDSDGEIYGRVTTNSSIVDGIHPNELYEILEEAGY